MGLSMNEVCPFAHFDHEALPHGLLAKAAIFAAACSSEGK